MVRPFNCDQNHVAVAELLQKLPPEKSPSQIGCLHSFSYMVPLSSVCDTGEGCDNSRADGFITSINKEQLPRDAERKALNKPLFFKMQIIYVSACNCTAYYVCREVVCCWRSKLIQTNYSRRINVGNNLSKISVANNKKRLCFINCMLLPGCWCMQAAWQGSLHIRAIVSIISFTCAFPAVS